MRKIRGIEKPVSEICYGCANDIMQSGQDNGRILDASLAAGITFYDTARCYGESEVSLGNWINSRKNREQIVLLTKGCHPKPDAPMGDRVTAAAIAEDLETSLNKLRTDYVDLYLLHRDDVSVPVSELVDELERQRCAGKIVAYGVSNWTLDRFREAQAYAKATGAAGFTVNSPNFSLAEQVNDPWQTGSAAVSIGGAGEKAQRDYYLKEQIPIIAYSSLGRGLFSGKFRAREILDAMAGASLDQAKALAAKGMDIYALRGFYSEDNIRKLARAEEMAERKGVGVTQIALAYLLNQELEVYPICSYTRESHLESNLRALDITLSGEELAWLNLEV